LIDPNQQRIQEQLRASMRPLIKVIGVLLLIAIAAGGLILIYFLRLAGGIWGGS
jgi:hypothetical protein